MARVAAVLAICLAIPAGCAGSGQRALPSIVRITFDATAYGSDGKASGWNAAITISASDTVSAKTHRDETPLHLPGYTTADLKRIAVLLHEWNRERTGTTREGEYLHRIQYSLYGNGPLVCEEAVYRHSRDLPEPVRELLHEALTRAMLHSLRCRT